MRGQTLSSDEQKQIQSFLQLELLERCKRNPKYSLRAFSRHLKLEPSFLSKIITGKRPITPNTFQRISEFLDTRKIDFIEDGAGSAKDNYNYLSQEADEIISHWYYFAILELAQITSFDLNPRQISFALGISQAESRIALDRLLKFNFLNTNPVTRKLSATQNSTLKVGPSTHALRQLQKTILNKAMQALEDYPVEIRDQSAMTMAIDSSLIPEAKEKIKKFRRSLCHFLQSGKIKDEVYQMSISFFPASQIKKKLTHKKETL